MRSLISCFTLLSILFVSAIHGQADIPTLTPAANFNPTADAQKLRDAMAGIGTNEQAIIDVLCYRVASQRATITDTYNRQFGRSLVADLISELSGSFRTLAVMLTYSMSEMLAIELHESLALAGTDEDSLMEVLLSRSNAELINIRNDFYTNYGYTLVTGIQLDTTGSMQDLLVGMAEGKRDESTTVNPTTVQSDVTRLYDAGAGQAGTNEAEFVAILGQRSYPHINSVSDEYAKKYTYSLEDVVKSEFTGDIQKALLDTLQYARSKATYFATRFKDSTFGSGTKDRNLDRQHASRCETDLGNIKSQYQAQYGVSLSSDVSSDTSGSHRTALLTLLG